MLKGRRMDIKRIRKDFTDLATLAELYKVNLSGGATGHSVGLQLPSPIYGRHHTEKFEKVLGQAMYILTTICRGEINGRYSTYSNEACKMTPTHSLQSINCSTVSYKTDCIKGNYSII